MKRSLSDTELLRAQDLLVQQATEGLSPEERAELEHLGAADVDEIDRAAAAVAVAVVPRETMPASLAAKLLAAAPGQNTNTAPAVPSVAAFLPDAIPMRARSAPKRSLFARPQFVGALLAAAGVVLAVGAWGYTLSRGPAPAPAAAAVVTRAELARTTDDLTEARWQSTTPGLSGTVAWSADRQRGIIELAGLPTLASGERFQLWLYDGSRDERYPLDGGLFERDAAGAALVPVAPRLPVGRLVKLVITVEEARGVVVSTFDRIVAEAALRQN